MSKQPDYYVILGLPTDASTAEIHEAARALAEKFPRNARDPAVNAAYRQLLAAYDVLGDPQRRALYDDQRAQQAPELLAVNTQLSRRTIKPLDDDQLLYLMATLRAPDTHEHKSIPLNLALVFDRSTSMSGERLAKVKAAARHLVQQLSPTDLLSVITFSDRAEVVVPASHVKQDRRIIGHINGVQASGGTEILQGLRAGVRELSRSPLGEYLNHVVLMTDGHTYGDDEQCLALTRSAASRGIAVSAFGIGGDWNDQFLDQLVTPSGGRSAHIDTPAQIADFLREQINGLGATYANNIRLSFELPRGVRCNYAIKLSPYSLPLDCNTLPMQLGAVEMRAPLSLLLELIVPPLKTGMELTLPLSFVVDIPSAQVRERSLLFEETVTAVDLDTGIIPPPVVLKAVQMLNLHRINEKAWQDFEAGDSGKATKRMEVLTTRLMEAGHPELAEQVKLEKQRLILMGTVSQEGRKRLKYGTRSLLTTALSFDNDD